jgi:hypothetical protein
MKKIISTLFAILFMAAPVLSYGQEETKTNENTEKNKKISYSFINEYGYYIGGGFGFTGIFVNGIRFNETQDLIGIGLGYEADFRTGQNMPIYVNYRHYFGMKKLKPLINIGIGTRLTFWESYDWNYWVDWGGSPKLHVTAGLYGTIAAGFKVKAFSFTSGAFIKSFGAEDFFGGIEVKVGYTF